MTFEEADRIASQMHEKAAILQMIADYHLQDAASLIKILEAAKRMYRLDQAVCEYTNKVAEAEKAYQAAQNKASLAWLDYDAACEKRRQVRHDTSFVAR